MTNKDDSFNLEIAAHMGATNEKISALIEVVHTTKDDVCSVKQDLKNVRDHNDKVVHELQSHFDGRISECHEDVMNMIDKTHLNELEVRTEITKAIIASEKRQRKYLGWVATVIGVIVTFLYQYGEPIFKFIMLLKED